MKHKCGHSLVILVTINNMYSGFGEKIANDRITIYPTELIPSKLTLIYGNLFCIDCREAVVDFNDDVKLQCTECGRDDFVKNLSLLITRGKNNIRPVILHDTCIETYKKYINQNLYPEKCEFEVIKNFKMEVGDA